MTLLDLIRKPIRGPAATATPAIPAIAALRTSAPVARIATVAVAGSADSKIGTDPSDLLIAYAERVAICIEADDLTGDSAHRTATGECGASLDELAARQIAYWRSRIQALPEPTDRRLSAIKPTCLEGLTQSWAHNAARLGWNEREMFGLDPAAPTVHNLNGLLPNLALTAFRRPVKIVEIRIAEAVIVTGSGSMLRHFNTGHAGPSIWEHSAFRLR